MPSKENWVIYTFMNVKGEGLLHWCQTLKSEEPLLGGPFNNMFEFKGLATVDSNEWIKGVKWCSEENSLTATWKDTHTLTHIYAQSAHSVLYSVCLKDREREKAQERERQRQTTETLETAYKDHLYWLLIPSHLILLSFTSHFASSTTHYILDYVLVGQCCKIKLLVMSTWETCVHALGSVYKGRDSRDNFWVSTTEQALALPCQRIFEHL